MRNLERGRSTFDWTARLTKAESLWATVRRHLERGRMVSDGMVLDPALWPIRTRDRAISGASVYVSSPYYGAAMADLGLRQASDGDTSGGSRKPRLPSAPDQEAGLADPRAGGRCVSGIIA